MAHLRQGRRYYESAVSLGGCQTRYTSSCRELLDARHTARAGWTLRGTPATVLRRMEFFEEQGGGEATHPVPLGEGPSPKVRRGLVRIRPALLQNVSRL